MSAPKKRRITLRTVHTEPSSTSITINLHDLQQEEHKRWESDAKLAGLPKGLSIKEAALAALQKASYMPLREPEDVAKLEACRKETGCEDDGETDLEDLDDNDFFTSDEEEEEEDDLSYIRTGQTLDMIGTIQHDSVTEGVENDRQLMRVVRAGLNDICKACKYSTRGVTRISKMLEKRPDLGDLNTIIQPLLSVCPTIPNLIDSVPGVNANSRLRPKIPEGAVQRIILPQTPPRNKENFLATGEGVKYCPKRDDSEGKPRFYCPVCWIWRRSWVGTDCHIRQFHTGVSYGPCEICNKFHTFSRGSFMVHRRNCSRKQQEN